MRRGWVVAVIGSCLVAAACAAPSGTLTQNSPVAQTTPSTEPSPSPSPPASPSSNAPLAISSFGLHSGEVGLAFSAINLGATGGAPPYSWTQAGGSLPPGLSLSQDGVISGSTTTPGTFTFGVRVADSRDGAALKSGSIRVYSAVAVTQACAGQCVRGRGCTTCGSFGTAAGGLAPYTYKVIGGATPPGMKLSGLSLTGGFPAGSFSLTVMVTDTLGGTETVGANWSIYNGLTFIRNSGATDCTNFGNPPQCSTSGWTYSGGNPSVAPKAVIVGYSQYCDPLYGCQVPIANLPPPQWKVVISGNKITFSAGGVPCNTTQYAATLMIELRDPSKCGTTSASNRLKLGVWLQNNC